MEIKINKTGIQTSPLESEVLIKFAMQMPPDIQEDGNEMIKIFREQQVLNADCVGSIPSPLSEEAVINSNRIQIESLAILIDKLGERIAYERTGVRLYDAIIAKMTALNVSSQVLKILNTFREQEAEHLKIVINALMMLGGDATAQTPCADVTSTASSGILKVATDPRTDAAQTFQALLAAELIDNASWELLIILAEKNQKFELLPSFQHALKQEQVHQDTIKSFLIGLL